MMNIQKITSMVLKRIRRRKRVVYFDPGDGYIWVTPDGCAAYRMPAGEVEFSLNKCESNEKLMDAVQERGHVCGKLTGNLRRIDYFTHKEIVTEIKSEFLPDASVWIKEKYLRPFKYPNFLDFLIKDETSSVLICETGSEPCGLIMPFKVEHEE